jgi:hypothetical protein
MWTGALLGVVGAALAQWACGASSPLFEGTSDGGVTAAGGGPPVGGATGAGGAGAVGAGGVSGFDGSGGHRTGTGGLSARETGGTGGSVVSPVGGSGGQISTEPYCPQFSFRGSPPHLLLGTTRGLADTYTPGCGASRGSGDASFAWEVPYSGRFRFDTEGSSFDTVLSIQDGVCSGKELACNDDSENSSDSEVTLDLMGGQNVTIVVDGYGGAEGSVSVHVTEVRNCPDMQLDSSAVPSTFGDETSAYGDRYTSACGAVAGSPDFVATFTAESSGVYVFDTQGSDFDTVLGVFEGPCGTTELACSDDYMVSTSRVSTSLLAGEQVTVVVDGYGGDRGNFRLSVDATAPGSCCDEHSDAAGCTPVDVAACVCASMPYCCIDGWDQACVDRVEPLGCGNCGQCPDEAFDDRPPISVSGSTLDSADRSTSGCGDNPRSGDYVMEYTAPYRSTYVFDTRGSDFDTVLSLKDGGCLGPVRSCNDDDDYGNATSMLVATMEKGETVALVVDGFQGAEGDFVLNVRDQKMTGDCCYATPEIPGCGEDTVAQCVCRYIPSCCDKGWTANCVKAVAESGCGTCQPPLNEWHHTQP